ncbi:MAG: hypothetical protein KBT82_06620 [Marinobacter sp.]|uniref:hypothetical protein n=1 Tax=Marinobacter sp. TaxID=50741 RepID=UPI001B7B5063|nr:hypothetical protein [Marinobacter sp.]MBQ0746319.1 hypothetical protein [Marinobacter sp.]MBQ0813839.1 hypothetical protein [Marinobacter sp.]
MAELQGNAGAAVAEAADHLGTTLVELTAVPGVGKAAKSGVENLVDTAVDQARKDARKDISPQSNVDGEMIGQDGPTYSGVRSGENAVTDKTLIDEIRSIPKGQRPDPSEYFSASQIESHLAQFDNGASRLMSQKNFDKYGIAQIDGSSFVMTRNDADRLLATANGDGRAMEEALGLPDKFFSDGNELVRIDIPKPRELNIRMPSGNEAGANPKWIPGGRLPDDSLEAVIDTGDIAENQYLFYNINF